MNHLVDTLGYWAVALFVLAEAFGVPLPGETVVIVAGIYAGHSHKLSPWVIFLVAAAAAVLGGTFGYTIGRVGGYRLVSRYGEKVRIDKQKLLIGRYLFDTYGVMVVFFGRFVSVLRTYAAFLAGTSRMRWQPFTVANTASGIIWAAVYTALAYFAGNTFRNISGTLDLVLAGVAVAVVVVVVLLARRKMGGLALKAEEAYPGALE